MAGRRLADKIRSQVLRRDGYKCKLCGASPRVTPETVLEVDHVVPFAAGGSDEPDNLQTLCRECNRGKGDAEPGNPTLNEKPKKSEVLAWLQATGASADVAAKHFGLARETVRCMISRRGRVAPSLETDDEESDDIEEVPDDENGWVWDPDDDRTADVDGNIEQGIRMRASYLAHPSSVFRKNQQQVAITMGIIIDKKPTAANAAKTKGLVEVHDLTTPEGRAAMGKELDAVPPDLFFEAWERRKVGPT